VNEKNKNTMGLYDKVNREILLAPKLFYAIVSAQHYTFYNIRPVFFKNFLNTPTVAYGILMGATQLVTFFTNMGIALGADRSQKPKTFMIGCLFGAALVFQCFYAGNITGNSIIVYGLLFLLFTTLMSPVQPILDRIVLDYLKNDLGVPQTLYGRQRLWGTLSYSINNFIVEGLIYSKGESSPNFAWIGVLEILFASLAIPTIYFLLPADRPRAAASRESPQILTLLRHREYLYFLTVILLNGITRGSMTHYLNLYYKNILKLESASEPPAYVPWMLSWMAYPFYKSPMATCSFFGIGLEVLILFISDRVLNTLGLHWPLLLSQVAQCVRFLGYMSIGEATPFKLELACSIELMKGLNFGLTHISGVQLATRLVPPELKATSQTIYAGTFVGLGAFIGALLGAVFKAESPKGFRGVFGINMACSVLATSLMLVKYGVLDGKLGRNREIPSREQEREKQAELESASKKASEKLEAVGSKA
jgi:MFS_1 like family